MTLQSTEGQALSVYLVWATVAVGVALEASAFPWTCVKFSVILCKRKC